MAKAKKSKGKSKAKGKRQSAAKRELIAPSRRQANNAQMTLAILFA